VTWDVLDYLVQRYRVDFVGARAPDGLPPGVGFIEVGGDGGFPRSFDPLRFRRSAERGLRASAAPVSLSLGAIAPATDVVWVQSVHWAWLRAARRIRTGRAVIPGRVRYLMPRHMVLLAMERRYFKRFRPRAIICPSEREVEDLAVLYDVDPSIAAVVPNPFDPRLFNFHRRTAIRAAVRERLRVADEDIALLFVANELHRKGFGETLSALARIDDDRVSLHLIGRASPKAYASTIERLGLSGRVHYHGPTNDIGWWYAGGDLLVLPTQYEPFGLVIVEALASGVPVITTRLAGAANAIEHGVTGLIQEDPYDVSELASLITSALDADLAQWGRTAAESVDEYQRDRVMARVESILFPNR
jgi:UDP-glucose:(heptosyl)LPS alpha-1,3-glucosyltransferase